MFRRLVKPSSTSGEKTVSPERPPRKQSLREEVLECFREVRTVDGALDTARAARRET